jgi:hypothetical protein
VDQQALEINIAVLESLGWFIVEDETDKDAEGYDCLLKCCRPDGIPIEEVFISPFLLPLYDEEDGSLEARLWFFAPRYTVNLNDIWELVENSFVDPFITIMGPMNTNPLVKVPYKYQAIIDFDPYGPTHYYTESGDTPALAVCSAYLEVIKDHEGNHCRQSNDRQL